MTLFWWFFHSKLELDASILLILKVMVLACGKPSPVVGQNINFLLGWPEEDCDPWLCSMWIPTRFMWFLWCGKLLNMDYPKLIIFYVLCCYICLISFEWDYKSSTYFVQNCSCKLEWQMELSDACRYLCIPFSSSIMVYSCKWGSMEAERWWTVTQFWSYS